ncbi:hypothetical protein [Pseudomonas shirazensis]|uniref:hypothetical protein n=1 Tax=Pseudomonas shirazensis TaxID=2745494 RepID=UPI003D296B9B
MSVEVTFVRDSTYVQLGLFETFCRGAQRQAEGRSGDYMMWRQHPRLFAALDFYDQEELTSGLCFAHQSGLCVLSMEGVLQGAQLLSRWWQSGEVEASNLAMRAYVRVSSVEPMGRDLAIIAKSFRNYSGPCKVCCNVFS